MAVAFLRGTTTGPNDLTVTVRDSSNNLIDPYRLEYSVFDYTTGTEVLIGSPVNTPLRISLGQYYADVVIAADANIGLWRIRWTIQETAASPVYQSVQEFQVVGSSIIPSFTGDANFDALVHSLRIILRDNNPDRNYSVDGKEKVRVKIGIDEYVLSLEELYQKVEEEDFFYFAVFYEEALVQSVTKDKKIQWKPITEVMKHDVREKSQYKITLEDGTSCLVTEDHSLFLNEKEGIKSIQTKDFEIGDDLVFIENDEVITKKIISNEIMVSIPYMYDLSVKDNENFVLESGILAHNSFRPPASEKFIQGQTQVFGFIWEDEELVEYIYMAVDDFNSRPPTTGIEVTNLWGGERRWRTTIILRAASFACFAISMNWIADEFSIGKDEKLTIKDKSDVEYSMTIEELFNIVYEIKKIEKDIQKEYLSALKKLDEENELCEEDLIISKVSKTEISENNIQESVKDIGIRTSFKEGKLLVRSMVNKDEIPVWCPITNILRHNTPHKRMFRISTHSGDSIVTEDHSLFLWETKDPIRADELEMGMMIVGLLEGVFKPTRVNRIEEVEKQEYSYDVSVPEAENAVLDSGILVHNSYSISGVSLDIEKSSKYQSMKDQYINEYDKLVEANKRSIKIIKGLRQQKYSVGISSALGATSRPGIQSRRNFVSPGYGSYA